MFVPGASFGYDKSQKADRVESSLEPLANMLAKRTNYFAFIGRSTSQCEVIIAMIGVHVMAQYFAQGISAIPKESLK